MTDRHVLIADRDPTQRQLVDLLLVADGYDIVTAADGREALEHLRDRTPTLVVLELDLPYATGDEICHAMRREPRLANVPVVLAASQGDPEGDMRGRRAGADLVLRKPLGEKNLRERARRLVELAEARGNPPTEGAGGAIAEALEALERGERVPVPAIGDEAPHLSRAAPAEEPPAPNAKPMTRPGAKDEAPAPAAEDLVRALQHENERLRNEIRRLRRELARDERELRDELAERTRRLDEFARRYQLLKESTGRGRPRWSLFGRRRR